MAAAAALAWLDPLPPLGMRLSPTPPHENAQPSSPSPSTPPTDSSLPTPDDTPHAMLAIPRPPLGHHASSQAESFITAPEHAQSPASFADDVHGTMSPVLPLEMDWEKHVSYIPFAGYDLLVDHLRVDDWPPSTKAAQPASDAPPPVARAAPLRKKARHFSPLANDFANSEREARRSVSLPNPPSDHIRSADPPSDVATNDRIYKQIQLDNMDRLDAIRDGNAIEAVVISPDDAQHKSLRHVKKRHSLRTESGNESIGGRASADASPAIGAESPPNPNGETKRVLPLRHKKAIDLARPKTLDTSPKGAPAFADSPPSLKSRTLRHERRALSADGRPQNPSDLPALTVSKHNQRGNPQLRHSSLPLSLGKSTDDSHKSTRNNTNHELRRSSHEHRLEHLNATDTNPSTDRNTTLVTNLSPTIASNSLLSPSMKSMKSIRAHNTYTPLSGISDRTEMEVCEAKNITLFKNSNDSVLLVHHGSATTSKNSTDPDHVPTNNLPPLNLDFPRTLPFAHQDRPSTAPEITLNDNLQTVDSPLTNPRAPPAPPAIQFIPPTPSNEGDRQLTLDDESDPQATAERSGSLMKRARRLSDSIIPFFSRSSSVRSQQNQNERYPVFTANDRLHPMWVPSYRWDEYDYSDSEDDDDFGALPRGGDTSEHPTESKRGLFPRQMSVRMPGFRGTGGFLLGNSLGVERHGTNSRRHHVELPSKHRRVRFPPLAAIKSRMRERSEARDEVAREKRRAELKEQISLRLDQDS